MALAAVSTLLFAAVAAAALATLIFVIAFVLEPAAAVKRRLVTFTSLVADILIALSRSAPATYMEWIVASVIPVANNVFAGASSRSKSIDSVISLSMECSTAV